MRLHGHPLHVMVIHFPIALWPAHWALHAFGAWLPPAVGSFGAFWLLVAGTALAWLAAAFGALDLVALAREGNAARLNTALWHAGLNGSVTIAFTALAVAESARYPVIEHHAVLLTGEAAVLLLLGIGNFIGGQLVWAAPAGGPDRAASAPAFDAAPKTPAGRDRAG